MQRLWVLSILSITQDAENAIEKLQNAKKRFCTKAAAILHRVTDKSCVKVSYNTTSGATPMRTTPSTRTIRIFPVLFLQKQLFSIFEDFHKKNGAPEC